jgi:hypothetical protein
MRKPNYMPKMIKPDPSQEQDWELFLGSDRDEDAHRSLGGSTLLALLGVPELEEDDEIFADYADYLV